MVTFGEFQKVDHKRSEEFETQKRPSKSRRLELKQTKIVKTDFLYLLYRSYLTGRKIENEEPSFSTLWIFKEPPWISAIL